MTMKRSIYGTCMLLLLATEGARAEERQNLRGGATSKTVGEVPSTSKHRRTTAISEYDLSLGSMAVALACDQMEEGHFPAQWAEDYGNDLPHPTQLQIQQGSESAFWTWSLEEGKSSSTGEWIVHGSWTSKTEEGEDQEDASSSVSGEEEPEGRETPAPAKKDLHISWNPQSSASTPSYVETNFFGQGQSLILKILEADQQQQEGAHHEEDASTSATTSAASASLLLCVCNSPQTESDSCDCSGL